MIKGLEAHFIFAMIIAMFASYQNQSYFILTLYSYSDVLFFPLPVLITLFIIPSLKSVATWVWPVAIKGFKGKQLIWYQCSNFWLWSRKTHSSSMNTENYLCRITRVVFVFTHAYTWHIETKIKTRNLSHLNQAYWKFSDSKKVFSK